MLNNTSSHSPHSGAMHVLVRLSVSSQGSPPYWLGCRIFLVELCQPIPQLAEQGLHWDQLDHWQSTAGWQNSKRVYWGAFSWRNFSQLNLHVHRNRQLQFLNLLQGQLLTHLPSVVFLLSDLCWDHNVLRVNETKKPCNGLSRQWLTELLPYLRQLV